MLCFTLIPNGRGTAALDLTGAYVVGSDGVPLRAELEYRDAQLVCAKRADGPASVALLWPVAGGGSVLLETSRLMDRDRPYNLILELARGRLMRINQKREEWGLFDFEGMDAVAREIDRARDLFVEALKADSLEEQSRLAQEALRFGFAAGEMLTLFHAEVLLGRRQQAQGLGRRVFGCGLDPTQTAEGYRQRLREGFDFGYLPLSWRSVEPRRQELSWRAWDALIEWMVRHRMPIKAGPLVSFHPQHLPDWFASGKADYEEVRRMVLEHVRRVIERYGNYVHHWDVVSGIHAYNAPSFGFEQLMDLTRAAVSLVKQLAPRAQAIVDLVAPWGEYYARNQRSVPPLLYADMVAQSGVGFDGLGVQLLFGAPADGMFVRDMFQISEKLDRLGNFGKPVHITAVQVPSAPVGGQGGSDAGSWHRPWDEDVQARWLKQFYLVALSKPFVESVTWRDLADHPGDELSGAGGLLRADLTPKAALGVLKQFRGSLSRDARQRPVAQPAP